MDPNLSLLRFTLLTGALAVGGWPSQAEAYCRSRSCDARLESCPRDEHGCVTVREPVFWPDGEITLWVDSRGSELLSISAEDTAAVLERAVDHWLQVECPDGSMPQLSVTIAGFAEEIGGDQGVTQSIVVYRDSGWTQQPNVAAQTLSTFEIESGVLHGADIVINSEHEPLAVDTDATQVDLESVLTHEVGHLLGLDHSDVPGATMQPESRGFGDMELRSLEPDDIAGICAIYGASAEPPDSGTDEPKDDPGCSLSQRRAGASPSAAFAALLGVLLLARRSRRIALTGARPA